jgi:hypothetical protein
MKNIIKQSACLIAASLALTFSASARADYVAPDIHHDQYGEVKVVVPITSGDASMWMFRLHNVANGMTVASASGGEMRAKVVLYGSGVKLLSEPMDPKLKEIVDAARAAGVQFNVCNFSLKGMNQDWRGLYGVQESDIVPSGFAEVGWLASHGWAVDPAN